MVRRLLWATPRHVRMSSPPPGADRSTSAKRCVFNALSTVLPASERPLGAGSIGAVPHPGFLPCLRCEFVAVGLMDCSDTAVDSASERRVSYSYQGVKQRSFRLLQQISALEVAWAERYSAEQVGQCR